MISQVLKSPTTQTELFLKLQGQEVQVFIVFHLHHISSFDKLPYNYLIPN